MLAAGVKAVASRVDSTDTKTSKGVLTEGVWPVSEAVSVRLVPLAVCTIAGAMPKPLISGTDKGSPVMVPDEDRLTVALLSRSRLLLASMASRVTDGVMVADRVTLLGWVIKASRSEVTSMRLLSPVSGLAAPPASGAAKVEPVAVAAVTVN